MLECEIWLQCSAVQCSAVQCSCVYQADYDTVRNYASGLGVVVWSKDDKRTLVVTKDGHNDVKR